MCFSAMVYQRYRDFIRQFQADVGVVESVTALERFIHWYDEGRIKVLLCYRSPLQYVKSLATAA